MFLDVSNLRGLGVVLGLLLLAGVFWDLRRYRVQRLNRAPVLLFSIALLAVSFFPDLVNALAGFFGFTSVPGGRLLALLIISVILLWPLSIRNRTKLVELQHGLNAAIRQFAIMAFRSAYAGVVPREAVWVIIPVLNEAENLPVILAELPSSVGDRHVVSLVVDDGSADPSAEVARMNGAMVAQLPLNCGGGTALLTGFELALDNAASAIVTMDGDGQHDPRQVSLLAAPILSGEADFVIGSRVLGTNQAQAGFRSIGVYVFSKLINLLMGTSITDCSSGFRAISPSVLAAIRLREPQYHTPELIVQTAKHGKMLLEIPIDIRERLSGTSKKGTDLKYGLMFARSILRAWLR